MGAVKLPKPHDSHTVEKLHLKAFAFVRHPLDRFVSGYGTVMRRLLIMAARGEKLGGKCMSRELYRIVHLPEPQRFRTFVDFFLARPEAWIDDYWCRKLSCAAHH